MRVENNFNSAFREFWFNMTTPEDQVPNLTSFLGDTELTAIHGKFFFETNETKLKSGRGAHSYRATSESTKECRNG